MTPVLIALPGNERITRSLSARTGWPQGELETRSFPDGETYLRLGLAEDVERVVLVCSLDRPDAKTLMLLFAADAARELGARYVGLVAPYLAYMRQDRRFHPGEAVTSRSFARLISSRFDGLLTVDPHLHRIHGLGEIYSIPTRVVHAAPALAEWIVTHVERPLLIGPDEESLQWVSEVGARANAPTLALTKVRRGDRDVRVSLPDVGDYRNHTPIVLDDIVSSARTMVETVHHLVDAGLRSPVCIGVHGIFAGEAERELLEAGAGRIVTTNAVPHPTNGIEIDELLSSTLCELVE